VKVTGSIPVTPTENLTGQVEDLSAACLQRQDRQAAEVSAGGGSTSG